MSAEEKVIFKSGAASTKIPRLDLDPREALIRLADRLFPRETPPEPNPFTRDEASEIAYRLVTRSEAQNTKILLVTDALQGAYARSIADGLKRETSLNASLGQEDQD